ncbi:MAG: RHS repeat protein [Planctomycetes bacterium]|nr:RHS repeat protein [Planctomycetota bacterium]
MGSIPCAEFEDPTSAAQFVFEHRESPCGGKRFGGTTPFGNQVDGFYSVQWTGTETKTLGDAMGRLVCDPDGGETTIGNPISLVWYCPEGSNVQSWTAPGVPGLFLACTKPAPIRTWCFDCDRLRSMQFGNPISIVDGVKLQRESDLSGATAKALTFTRFFRSDMRGFLSEYSSVGLNPAIGDGCLEVKYFSQGLNQWKMGCARILSGWNDGYVYRSIQSAYVSYQPSPDGQGLAQRLGALEQVVQRLPDGSSLVRTPRNVMERFLPSGRLKARSFADGAEQTMIYSTAETPISIAPRAGLLIGVVDSFGRSLSFAYDAAGRLSTMHGPDDGVFTYNTDDAGNVVQVSYPDGATRQYRFNEHVNTAGLDLPFALTGIIDENNIRFANFGYSTGGLASFTEHAGGVQRYDVSFPQVHLPEGPMLTYQVGTFGRFVSPTRITRSCDGCATNSLMYSLDATGNPLSSRDWNGNVSCRAYDTARALVTAQVDGALPNVSCASVVMLNAVLPASARKVSTQWHPDWRLATKVAEPGRITTSIYNGQPDPFNGNAVASCAPATALLPDGKPIAVLCKRVEQATTDTDGHLGFSATLQPGVPDRTTTWTYNQYGQVLTENGPRTDVDDTTTYAYYSDTSFTGEGAAAQGHYMGDLQSVTNAAGKVTQYTQYNKHGQVLESQDPNGVVTTNTYDLRQRLLSTTVGGQTTSYQYDPVGQLKKVTLPDQSWIGYDYDDAHRQVAVYDNHGNRTDYTLDNAGNRIGEQTKDPSGALKRQLSRSINALGRVQRTTGREQ